jgi:hypothetical protein
MTSESQQCLLGEREHISGKFRNAFIMTSAQLVAGRLDLPGPQRSSSLILECFA